MLMTWSNDANAQIPPGAANEAVQQAAAREHQAQDASRVRSLLGLDPTRITTVGLWPGPVVPCKLPKRERPYECQRILVGPAIILTRLVGEFVVAHGDQAVVQGKRSWWTEISYSEPIVPLALAAGEVLYHVGNSLDHDKDLIVTVYRP